MTNISYYVADTSTDNPNVTEYGQARFKKSDAMRDARKMSKERGLAYVVAYDSEGNSVGHLPYYDGEIYAAGLEGEV